MRIGAVGGVGPEERFGCDAGFLILIRKAELMGRGKSRRIEGALHLHALVLGTTVVDSNGGRKHHQREGKRIDDDRGARAVGAEPGQQAHERRARHPRHRAPMPALAHRLLPLTNRSREDTGGVAQIE